MKNIILQISFFVLVFVSCKNNSSVKNGNISENSKCDNFDDFFYIEGFDFETIKELKKPYYLGGIKKQKIIKNEFGIYANIESDEMPKTIVKTNDYLISSYTHWGVGTSRTIICNLDTKTSTNDNCFFVTKLIGHNLLLVQRDYYDNREIEDPEYQGHIFEDGEFNLETNTYKKLR